MGVNISINKAEELTKGENKVLEGLKKSYLGVEHEVYIYAQCVISGKRPDFIIIDAKRGISILEVKDWSVDYIKNVNRRTVQLLDRECENPIMQVNGYKNILSSALFTRDFNSVDQDSICKGIIFTNLSEEDRSNENLSTLFNSSVKYLFKKDMSNIDLDKIFDGNIEYNDSELKMIRVALFPEIEITTVQNSINSNSDIKSLDFEQEEFAKRIPIGNYMVTGIPGSGKTVILLSRAIYLIKENPNWKVLILTYNKSLSCKISSKIDKFAEIFKNDINNKNINLENIEVRHFHEETKRLSMDERKPIDMDSNTWFSEEVVKIANKNATETYDAILIDEYQDFRMSWIELCVKLCKTYTLDKTGKEVKNIFLAGDRLQSIYNNKDISWRSIGIDMRGRSKLLKTSYRSAKQHMSLALDFLRMDEELKEEVDRFYQDDSEDNNLGALNSGSVEFISGNYSIIGDKINELKNQGYKNEDFLILAASKNICLDIKSKSSELIKYEMEFVKDLDNSNIQDNIILTTYHSSKGLEAKVVFLTTIDRIYSGNDIGDKLKRKTAYVGITRASEKLYVHSGVRDRGELITELKEIYDKKEIV